MRLPSIGWTLVLSGSLFCPLSGAPGTLQERVTSGVISPWDLQAGDRFGKDLAISDKWLLVGSPGDDLVGRDSGSVAAFERTAEGWIQRDILAPKGSRSREYFGSCLALSETTCVIGAPWDGSLGTRSGAVYVFEWDGKFWQQEQKILAPDGARDDRFGHALDFDGRTLLVGARFADAGGKDSGAAYVFELSGDGPAEFIQKLLPETISEGAEFGFSVSLDGNALAVGAWASTHRGQPSGSVHLYRKGAEGWNQEAQLSAPDNPSGTCFGLDVDLLGDLCAVGAPWENTGAERAGAVYIWRHGEAGWRLEQRLRQSPRLEAAFGICVMLAPGGSLLVGARQGSRSVQGAGSVSHFRREELGWLPSGNWSAGSARAGDDFGLALGAHGSVFVVGARRGDPEGRGADTGCVYLGQRSAAPESLSTGSPNGSARE